MNGSSEIQRRESPRSGFATKHAFSAEHLDVMSKRPILCPMLWSEDELAAFISCLGFDEETSRRIQVRKFRGVEQLLQMSDEELHTEIGLEHPTDQNLVRKALIRFLELDRWQNNQHMGKLPGLGEDPMLSDFIVTPGELDLGEVLSQGSFGLVYQGTLRPRQSRGRLKAGREYAVAAKEMKGDWNVRLRELLKESRVMAALSHTNLCMFLGICADTRLRSAGKQYILSELMDGSLFDLVHNPLMLPWRFTLTLERAMLLTVGICHGLGYLHRSKLVHADLKSPNILVTLVGKDVVPKLCDFGHVAMRAHPAPHHRCGTPHWAAPEALRSEAVSPAADVFSCGAILWEMLAEMVPHRNLSYAQVLGAVGWCGWTPDMGLLPNIPEALRVLLLKCFCFAPSGRPLAVEVAMQLQQIRRRACAQALTSLRTFLGG